MAATDMMRWIRAHKNLVSNTALFALLLGGAAYLGIVIMRINPFQSTYSLTVDLDRTGGLQTNGDVTYRGYRIGTVKSMGFTDTGVRAKLEIESEYKIPAHDLKVAVQALSAAGEQYIDFRPASDTGPYLKGGDTVQFNKDLISTPPPLSQVLTNANGFIEQLNVKVPGTDENRFKVIVDQLGIALGGGPTDLGNVVRGLSEATAGLDSVLPQTTQLLSNLRTIMATTSLAQPDLGTLTRNFHSLFTSVSNADQELNNFLSRAPGQFNSLSGSLGQLTPTLTGIVQNFAHILNAGQLRAPALAALFPAMRDAGEALAIPEYNGDYHVLADIWIRPWCDYPNNQQRDPTKVVDPRVPLYSGYCPNPAPGIQVRGAANAPRPNVPDNTSQPPPGANLSQVSTPLPTR